MTNLQNKKFLTMDWEDCNECTVTVSMVLQPGGEGGVNVQQVNPPCYMPAGALADSLTWPWGINLQVGEETSDKTARSTVTGSYRSGEGMSTRGNTGVSDKSKQQCHAVDS